MKTTPLNSKKARAPGKRNARAPSKTVEAIHPHRIIVPVDFSEPARKALLYAASLAGKFEARLILVHVAEPIPCSADYGYGDVLRHQPDDAALERTRRHLRRWARRAVGATTAHEISVRCGRPFEEIGHLATEQQADLIVVGTHGHAGLDRMLLGSTAERVIRFARCPVLVVREREREFLEIPGRAS